MFKLKNLLKSGLIGKGLNNPSVKLSRRALDIRRAILKKVALFLFMSFCLILLCAHLGNKDFILDILKCLIMSIIVARKLNSADGISDFVLIDACRPKHTILVGLVSK